MSKMKYLLSLVFKKKKDAMRFRLNAVAPRAVKGTTERFGTHKNRLLLLKRMLKSKKNNRQVAYSNSSKEKKVTRTMAGFFLVVCCVVLIVSSGISKRFAELELFKFFTVSEILFDGTDLVSDATLREVSGIIPYQTNLIGLDIRRIEIELEKIPWIAEAKLIRNWPSTVEISVVENIPVALLHDSSGGKMQLYYVDKWGVPFLLVEPGSDIDFPVITGLNEIKNIQKRERALTEALVFLKKIGRNHPHLPAHSVSEIHLSQAGELVVYLVEYPFPIYFGNGNTKKKYLRLVEVLKTLYKKQKGRDSISNIRYIQMDYLNDKVLVAESG